MRRVGVRGVNAPACERSAQWGERVGGRGAASGFSRWWRRRGIITAFDRSPVRERER